MRIKVAKSDAKAQLAEPDIDDRFRKGVGSLLRATRVRLGEDVQDVASVLRIRRTYLEAIEDGRTNDLPGLTYAIGFVRTYAEHLGLDGAEVVRRFKTEAQAMGANNDLTFPSPVQEGRIPGGAILFVALLIAVLAYGGWYYMSSQGKTLTDIAPALSEKLTSMMESVQEQRIADPGPVAEPASTEEKTEEKLPAASVSPAPVTSEPTTAEPPVATSGDATSVPAAEPAPAPVETTAPVAAPVPETAPASSVPETATAETPPAEVSAAIPAPAPAAVSPQTPENTASQQAPASGATTAPVPAPAVESQTPVTEPVTPQQQIADVPAATDPAAAAPAFGAQGPDVRIVLRAVADSWIQIREANGDLVNAQLLRPGERYNVPNRAGLVLLTGNAGGLELIVDGQKAPPLGPQGSIRRNVALDPAKLLAGSTTTE
ncbi:DUF4115 domain-containing protein [Alphaproteobacteria bacterium HT1-32]|nr:DUF4115 domain-containing protein [Alphaproteobacteria bacterium HT1-32]